VRSSYAFHPPRGHLASGVCQVFLPASGYAPRRLFQVPSYLEVLTTPPWMLEFRTFFCFPVFYYKPFEPPVVVFFFERRRLAPPSTPPQSKYFSYEILEAFSRDPPPAL